jgi:hypothetical protein
LSKLAGNKRFIKREDCSLIELSEKSKRIVLGVIVSVYIEILGRVL